MANIKSSKKRILVAERNRIHNVALKSAIKTAIKKTLESAQGTDQEDLKIKLSKTYSLYDKAVQKGVLHRNTVARKKSRLTLNINKLIASSEVQA